MDNNISKDSLGFLSTFNLKTTPFTSSIDTGYLCQSRQFKDTLARLCYAAENRMFAVLTGPVGVGKSTVLRAFNDAIDSSRFEVLYISQSNLSPRWLYSIPLSQLGINAKFYANDAKKQFHEQLLSITTVKKKQVVMIIDEAHLINHQTLQEIRFLLNCRFDAGNPLSLIIAGQNELCSILEREENQAITQRIDLLCRMTALDDEQTASYIAAHLRYAGATDSIYSTDAIMEISSRSRGVPRIINKICTHTMLYASCQGVQVITKDLVEQVLKNELPQCILM